MRAWRNSAVQDGENTPGYGLCLRLDAQRMHQQEAQDKIRPQTRVGYIQARKGIHQHQFAHHLRAIQGELKRQRAAHRNADQVKAGYLQHLNRLAMLSTFERC